MTGTEEHNLHAENRINGDDRLSIDPYPNKGRFRPADWVYVVTQSADGTRNRRGPYMVELVTAPRQYTLCDKDATPVSFDGKRIIDEEDLEAASPL
ncbi:hypothetical protein ASPBRDRAFT_45888 [Aspergillus brasiliensis CBS 101740]|uniref:Uncharacterized protein n=1 Tax=Aspergillus brasiliensis (strain CBS 101740 / IMI 381727 / IBT 21946) TaxID=767769 RepID=A0A1L9UCZ7_ASPBC|nr:hypothetical protein ASPBRDRAFT_45888 [Aspergillus brasiliensis CBS 101740]